MTETPTTSPIECEEGCACHSGTMDDGNKVRFDVRASCPTCGAQIIFGYAFSAQRRCILHTDPMCEWLANRIAALPVDQGARDAAFAALENEILAHSKAT